MKFSTSWLTRAYCALVTSNNFWDIFIYTTWFLGSIWIYRCKIASLGLDLYAVNLYLIMTSNDLQSLTLIYFFWGYCHISNAMLRSVTLIRTKKVLLVKCTGSTSIGVLVINLVRKLHSACSPVTLLDTPTLLYLDSFIFSFVFYLVG